MRLIECDICGDQAPLDAQEGWGMAQRKDGSYADLCPKHFAEWMAIWHRVEELRNKEEAKFWKKSK